MDHLSRVVIMLALSAALAGGGCDKSSSRARCTGETDATTCKSPEACVWLHGDDGYFCAALCVGGACSGGLTCKTGQASSCQACQDLLDICG